VIRSEILNFNLLSIQRFNSRRAEHFQNILRFHISIASFQTTSTLGYNSPFVELINSDMAQRM
jgi:hypothetical protein